MLTTATAAAWLTRRRYVAVFAGVVVWGLWLAAIVAGGSTPPTRDADGHWVGGRLALGDGESDAAHQIVSVDHVAFYLPARLVRQGRDGEIYDYETIAAEQNALFPSGDFEGKLEAYRNPPFYVLLHLPTAALPYAASAWIWNGVNLLALVGGVLLLRPARPHRVVLWSLTFLPTFTVFSYGQTSLVSFFVFCAAYRLLEADREFLAGFVAAFLWFKPPLLLGLLVWWALDWRKSWPALAGLVAGGAALLAVSYPVVPHAWPAFLAQLPENVRFTNFEWWKSHNARAFWRLLLTTDAGPLPTLLWVASAAVGVAAFARVWRKHRDDLPVVFGCSLLLMFWASPHTMVYEWVAAVVPATLWWKHRPARRDLWAVLMAVTWVAMFVSTEVGRLQDVYLRGRLGYENPPILQISIPVLAAVGWVLVRTFTRDAPTNPPKPTPPVRETARP